MSGSPRARRKPAESVYSGDEFSGTGRRRGEMTHRLLRFLGFTVMLVGVPPTPGQMHKVAPPENVVRAVGVYEWTGDMGKPTASRLIPVSLFIDSHLEDAGVYMARPVPFALGTGTVYEIDQAGISKGLLDLLFARHLESADLATVFDDGWFGYGSFKAPSAPKPLVATGARRGGGGHRAENRAIAPVDDDPNRPHLIRKPGSEGDAASAEAGKDGGSGSGAGNPSGNQSGNQNQTTAADDDPDRPHLTRKPDSSGTAGSPAGSTNDSGQGSAGTDSGSQTASTGSIPADDPDRPTLKKRTPEQAKQARRESEQSSVSGETTSLNDDPNRPTLHRGVPAHALTEVDLPKLKGVPENLHQMVAVSDAKNREPHDFARAWQDDAERATVLASMQTLAQNLLASYGAKAAAASSPAAKSGTATGTKPATRSTVRKKTTPATPATVPLLDEELKGYTLSYGGADTFVYMAHTAGDGDALRYVTVVAQRDSMGTLQPAIQSVTDAGHLDRTPWMRLVDVVDAEASNRASLLFELRGQTAREFALYRVIAARADQTFVTGTTQ
jgi:hypothetical protein